MGAADVVPGVSGGTVALITGIYDELLTSIKRCGPDALLILFRQGPVACWRYTNANFLLALLLGVAISVKSLASVISHYLDTQALLVWAFFSGLIAASIVLLIFQQSRWRVLEYLLCAVGICVVVLLASVRPAQMPDSYWALFGGGFVAICAMILPGISGSFLLLLMGLYARVLEAIEALDIPSLLVFALGCICGLLVFSRLLSWLLARYYNAILALLIGFLIGSLSLTWPWKALEPGAVESRKVLDLVQGEATDVVVQAASRMPVNVLPEQYLKLTSADPQIFFVILFVCGGAFLVLLVDLLARKFS